MQGDLFSDNKPELLIDTDGMAVLYKAWLAPAECEPVFSQLKAELAWEQTVLNMYGKSIAIPRLNAWYGDRGSAYRYSGAYFAPHPWTQALLELNQRLESFTSVRFNSVLANYYRDGQDGVAWHSDDEPELGLTPTIASLSLGASRRFHLRHKTRALRSSVELADGDLLVMSGRLQANWQHQLPKTKQCQSSRINLTYRWVGPGSGG